MPIDASIYRGIEQPAPLLNQVGGLLQVQGEQMKIQQQQQALKAQQAMDDAMKSAINPDGSFNRDALRQSVVQKGFGHVWPQIDEQLTKAEKARADLQEVQVKTAQAKQDYGGALAASVKAMNYDPGAFVSALNMGRAQGILSDQMYTAALQKAQADPGNIKTIVDSMIASSPKQAELENARTTSQARALTATTGAAKAQAELTGAIPPTQYQASELDIRKQELERQNKAQAETARHNATDERLAGGRLAVEQAREKREAAQDVGVNLTPQGLDIAAENFAKTGQLPPMGMGKQGAAVRSKIINRAAELHPDLDLASAKAGFVANEGSLKKLQTQRDAISAFENTAGKNIDIFLNTAGKVVDTGSPMANSVARAISGKMLGSPNQAAYDAARQVAINEVAKITSNPGLSGTLSDSARKEVENFNPSNATLKQTVAVMRILKQDMANRAAAYDQQIAEIKGRIGGKSEAPSGNRVYYDANGNPIKK